MKFVFNHYNYNVLDLEKSMAFYEAALGLKEVRRKEAPDGSWKLVYLGDGVTDFQLELTWLRVTEKNLITWVKTNSIWLLPLQITTLLMKNTKKWAASVLKIQKWVFISSMTPITTGWKSYQKRNNINLKQQKGSPLGASL